MPNHNNFPSTTQDSIDDQFNDMMGKEFAEDHFDNIESEHNNEVLSPQEAVAEQTNRVEKVLNESVMPNTNRADMQRFADKLDRKRNEATAATFEFNKDTIKQNEAALSTLNFDKDALKNEAFVAANYNFDKDTIQSNDFAPGTTVSVGRNAYKENPAFIDDGWTVNSVNKDGTYDVTKYGASRGENGQMSKTVTKEALESWQPTTVEQDDAAEETAEDDMERYNTRTAKAIDWVAEKTDNQNQNSASSDKLYNLAYRIDEEGVRGVARSALKRIGRIGAAGRKRRADNRATKRAEKIHQREVTAAHTEAIAMDSVRNDQIEANKMNSLFEAQTEANAIDDRFNTQAEAEQMNEVYDAHTQAEQINERYDVEAEAEQMNNEIDAQSARKAAEERAYAARLKRARRILEIKNGSKERYDATLQRARSVGKVAAQLAGNVKTYHTAGKEALKKEADLANENQKDYDLAS